MKSMFYFLSLFFLSTSFIHAREMRVRVELVSIEIPQGDLATQAKRKLEKEIEAEDKLSLEAGDGWDIRVVIHGHRLRNYRGDTLGLTATAFIEQSLTFGANARQAREIQRELNAAGILIQNMYENEADVLTLPMLYSNSSVAPVDELDESSDRFARTTVRKLVDIYGQMQMFEGQYRDRGFDK